MVSIIDGFPRAIIDDFDLRFLLAFCRWVKAFFRYDNANTYTAHILGR